MKYRRLGRTGLGVGPISLGTMGFGPPTQPQDAERLIRCAIDRGVNLVDTANCYDGPKRGEMVHGHAEAMLGQILAGGLRDEVILLTKVGVPMRPGPQHRGLSATHILRELDASLKRLRTTYVDVYMIHWPDAFAQPQEVLRVIDQATRAGKVRHFGVSNHLAWEVCEYLWQGDLHHWIKPGVAEIPLSILDRRYENDLPFYSRHEVGVLVYQPLAGGLLTDRKRQPDPTETPSAQPRQVVGWTHDLSEEKRQTIERLGRVADDAGLSLSGLALRWVRSHPLVTSIILGARDEQQLDSAVLAVQEPLPADVLAAIDTICPGPEKPKPRFER